MVEQPRQRPTQPLPQHQAPPPQPSQQPPQAQRTAARPADHQPDHGSERAPPRIRTRTPQRTVHDDPFHIPVEEIPEGSSYEWKRFTVSGMEDPFYLAEMRRQGWEPVDPRHHPSWVPPGYKEPTIIRGGLILMERPKELTNEARAEQRQLARQQMREAEQRLGMTPRDTLTRQHPGIEAKVTKEYCRQVVEE